MTIEKRVDIEVHCPSCKKVGHILVDEDTIKNSAGGVCAVKVSEELVCKHSFIVYVDRNFTVRDYFICDFVIELPNKKKGLITTKSTVDKDFITKIVNDIKKRRDPAKEFYSFLSILITEVMGSENLFLAGSQIGEYLWNKRREPLIKLGASFITNPQLILKSEIAPIFQKIAKVEKLNSDYKIIIIHESIVPQFMVGLSQGIIDAISNYMNNQGKIVLEYLMSEETVSLTLKEAEI